MLSSVLQVEIDFAGHPLFVALGRQGGDETQTGGGIGEARGDASATLDLTVDAFEAIGGAQAGALAMGPIEDREGFGQVLFGRQGELGGVGFPGVERLTQEPPGLGLVGRVEEGTDAPGDRFSLIVCALSPCACRRRLCAPCAGRR